MRNVAERCIGVLKSKFRCLQHFRTILYNPDRASRIIYACVALHNIELDAGDWTLDEYVGDIPPAEDDDGEAGESHVLTPRNVLLRGQQENITPSVPVLLIVILIFVVPKDPTHGFQNLGLLTWEEANSKAHWGVVLVICSGLTLAEASKVSGLSAILVDHLRALKVLPSYVVVSILCFAASILTVESANGAYSQKSHAAPHQFFESSLLAVALEVHPLYFAIPVAIACSFSFMLPAATPPNAIVYEMGKFKISDMASPGFLMNTVCVTVELINIHPLESLLFGVYNYSARAAQNRTETPAPSG
ncbi:hypothetical protein HPB51_000394 [Rhipicephalus microplus]|uniref:DDE Tnp4 domain-containing protein n=1 Tax=Rhipicephalus microplus TaxID=6941 RepID=A0A9J6DR35_RHIMP|nr:hypothetical protein HPB51_000394 [Rhipicephalus microplus]